MAKLYNVKRVLFPRNKQRSFIINAKIKLNISDKSMANLLKISQRTLTDWKKEKYIISLPAVKILASKTKINIPKETKILPAFWSVKKAAQLGAKATIKKYGKICTNERKRKKGWRSWWESKGRFLKGAPTQPKKIYLPKKSENLAEFVGIMIGDGGITDYQLTITLNKITDKKYTKFVYDLINELFKTKARKNYRQSVVNLQISRKNLVTYCLLLGLKKGNKIKQKVDIPDWIKVNDKFMIACLKGLLDTDGSVFMHKYKVNKKRYSYTKMAFTTCSKPLLISIYQFLQKNKIKCRYSRNKDVRIDGQQDIERYFRLIGSHNPKHINKFKMRYAEREPAGTAEVC